MTPHFNRLSKTGKIGLCTTVAVFAAFLVVGTTWGRGGGGGGGGGKAHPSPTGECTVCHLGDLKDAHPSCGTCHIPPGKSLLKVPGATFACRDCHDNDPSVELFDYHANMNTAHTPEGTIFKEACRTCHGTGVTLPEIHAELDQEGHLPVTVDCPDAVKIEGDDIFCYCLECHKNPDRISELPNNAECASCHDDVASYDPTPSCPHDIGTSHEMCIDCHVECDKQ